MIEVDDPLILLISFIYCFFGLATWILSLLKVSDVDVVKIPRLEVLPLNVCQVLLWSWSIVFLRVALGLKISMGKQVSVSLGLKINMGKHASSRHDKRNKWANITDWYKCI